MNIHGDDDARLYLRRRRAILQSEIANLRGRLDEIEFFLLELDAPAVETHAAPTASKPKGTLSPNGVSASGLDLTRQALKKGGTKGITAQQLARTMNVPVGTASSRLSDLKKRGEATHDKPVYYPIPSGGGSMAHGNNPGEP